MRPTIILFALTLFCSCASEQELIDADADQSWMPCYQLHGHVGACEWNYSVPPQSHEDYKSKGQEIRKNVEKAWAEYYRKNPDKKK